jgi:hypothetical protein
MAYDFNGSNQSLTMSSASVSSLPVTMACWFNSRSNSAIQVLVCITPSAASDARYFVAARGDLAGDPIHVSGNNVSGRANSTTGYSTNTWHHACGIVESATSRTIYLDGGSSATNTVFTATANFFNQTIGAQRVNGGSPPASLTNGLIAEVGIWDVALTPEEIASLAKGMTCDKVRPQSLVFYAPLVRDLIDAKGGLTITNNNTATVANHPRVYA